MANDADSGVNGEVYYTLQPTMFSGMFRYVLKFKVLLYSSGLDMFGDNTIY